MRHGLAQERDFNALANNNLVTMFKTNLNEEGQAEGFKLLKEGNDALNDPRIEPTEAKRIYQEKVDQANALKDDARYTIDKELQPGYSEGWGSQKDGYESNTPYTRTRKQNGEWEYRQNYSYYEQDETGEYQERQLTPKEWIEIYQPEPFIVGEQKYMADGFNYETGQWNMVPDPSYDPNAEANAEAQADADYEAKINERLKQYNAYKSSLGPIEDPLPFHDSVDENGNTVEGWQSKTYGNQVTPPQAAAPQPVPAGQPAPDGQPAPAPQPAPDPAAVAPPQAQPAPQPVEQTPPEQPVQADQPAGNVSDPTAALGTQQNPHQVINQAEAEQMVQNGEIQPGDIVTTADGIQFSAGNPATAPLSEATQERLKTHNETLMGMRAAINREDRKYMTPLVSRVNEMIDEINRVNPEADIPNQTVQSLSVVDAEEFERFIDTIEMHWPKEFGELPTGAKPFVHEPSRRENEAIAEQAEAQRLDAEEEAKRVQFKRERIPMSAEEARMREDRAMEEEARARQVDRERADMHSVAGLAFDPGGEVRAGRTDTPMDMPADDPRVTGHKLRDGTMQPTTAPNREYMAELERRDAEMRDRAESVNYEPDKQVAAKYGINQNFQTHFGEQQPITTLGVLNGQPHQYPTDNYKVPVYPGAAEADQNSVEGIELQMQYNTAAWQRDPNKEVERVSAEQLMEQTRRKYNQQPSWQGPLQGF